MAHGPLTGMTLRRLKDAAARHGIRPTKALGQHFLADANLARRIVTLAGVGPGDRVLEVGAGLGSLTLPLAESGAEVTALELDRKLLPALEEVVAGRPNVRIVHADAMEIDWREVLIPPLRWRMVSNLPYNVAVPLILGLLERGAPIEDYVVMVQREVGDRLTARAGDPEYGAVSIRVAYFAEASRLRRVTPTVFWPQPKVESVLVRLKPKAPTVAADTQGLFTLVREAFGQRRKTMRNALVRTGIARDDAEAILARCEVEASARPEELSLETFGCLAREWLGPADPVVSRGAPAKVNVFLRVLGRRDDGFHDLESLVLPVSLEDRVEITLGEEKVAGITSGSYAQGAPLADPENLVWRAANAMGRRCGRPVAGRFSLLKEIPVAAGLGGGSADAAATLLALDELWGCGLSEAELLKLAGDIGSDVPALLMGGPVLASGRGERVERAASERLWWILLPVRLDVSAAEAYRWWEEDGAGTGPDPSALLRAVADGALDEIASFAYNDLEQPVTARHPEVGRARRQLLEAGALAAIMSGSGPTVAGLARDGRHAAEVAGRVSGTIRVFGPAYSQSRRSFRGRPTAGRGTLDP